MKIADLFVLLGVKGDEKSKKAIGGVTNGLSEVKSMSLGAKAAIVGVIYGLEQMMSHSMKTGAGLYQFSKFTGLSADQLQRWQYAAKMASVSNQEVEGSIKSVQSAMTNMLLGKGAPEGMSLLASTVGFDASKARDTFYVMEKLQEFAKKAPKDVGNAIMQSFGISEGMITAMRRNAFTAKSLAAAPVYSSSEIKKLEKINAEWAKINHKMKMAMGRITAKEGVPILEDIGNAAESVVKLTESLVKLSSSLHVFEIIGTIIEGWTSIFTGLREAIELLNSTSSTGKKFSDASSFIGDVAGWLGDATGITSDSYLPENKTEKQKAFHPDVSAISRRIAEKREQVVNNNSTKNSSPSITQTLNFKHDGKDAEKTKRSAKEGVVQAYRQISQGQEM